MKPTLEDVKAHLRLGCLSARPLGLSSWVSCLHFEVPSKNRRIHLAELRAKLKCSSLLCVRIGLEHNGILSLGQIFESLVLRGTVFDNVPHAIAVPLGLMKRRPSESNLGRPNGRHLQEHCSVRDWTRKQLVVRRVTCRLVGALLGGWQADCVCTCTIGEVNAVFRFLSFTTTRTWISNANGHFTDWTG